MAQKLRHLPCTTKAQGPSHSSPCGTVVDTVATGSFFLWVLQFSPFCIIQLMLHTHSLICQQNYITTATESVIKQHTSNEILLCLLSSNSYFEISQNIKEVRNISTPHLITPFIISMSLSLAISWIHVFHKELAQNDHAYSCFHLCVLHCPIQCQPVCWWTIAWNWPYIQTIFHFKHRNLSHSVFFTKNTNKFVFSQSTNVHSVTSTVRALGWWNGSESL